MAGFISSVSWFDGNPHLRVYKGDGTKVTEQAYDGKWYQGAFSANGTTVGSTSWLDSSGQIHIRVYVGSGKDDKITEYCWDKDQWYIGAFAANGDGASATSWLQNNQIHIRTYVRSSSGKVTEYCWDGNGWYVGAYPG
ncbi:MAG: hypothetical protein AB1489_23420 [Acidobacteriota bacterium]